MIYAILLVLVAGFFWFLFGQKRRYGGFVEREVISEQEYLDQLRGEAKHVRCPHPAYKGHRDPCGRAPGRPCVPGCQGRRDLSTRWHG